jgi:hypothetical protein
MPDIIYLAAPYSHPDPTIRLERFIAINKAAGRMMTMGKIVFSPISHSHPIAEQCDLPLDWKYWELFDRTFLSLCSKLIVLRLPGWQISKGVLDEMGVAVELGIPVEFMEPE